MCIIIYKKLYNFVFVKVIIWIRLIRNFLSVGAPVHIPFFNRPYIWLSNWHGLGSIGFRQRITLSRIWGSKKILDARWANPEACLQIHWWVFSQIWVSIILYSSKNFYYIVFLYALSNIRNNYVHSIWSYRIGYHTLSKCDMHIKSAIAISHLKNRNMHTY